MFPDRRAGGRRADDEAAALCADADGAGDAFQVHDHVGTHAAGAKLDQKVGAAGQGPGAGRAERLHGLISGGGREIVEL